MYFSQVARARLVFQWIKLMGNPLDTERVFKLADIGIDQVSRDPELLTLLEKQLAKVPGFDTLFQQKYYPTLHLPTLGQLASGTFGNAISQHYVAHQLDPNFYTSVPITNRLSYASELMRRTHDIWHVVLGRGVDYVDEVFIQAFIIGQSQDPLAAAIVAAGILHAVTKRPDDIGQVLGDIASGYQQGKNAKLLVGFRWDDYYELPLTEVQSLVGCAPAS